MSLKNPLKITGFILICQCRRRASIPVSREPSVTGLAGSVPQFWGNLFLCMGVSLIPELNDNHCFFAVYILIYRRVRYFWMDFEKNALDVQITKRPVVGYLVMLWFSQPLWWIQNLEGAEGVWRKVYVHEFWRYVGFVIDSIFLFDAFFSKPPIKPNRISSCTCIVQISIQIFQRGNLETLSARGLFRAA